MTMQMNARIQSESEVVSHLNGAQVYVTRAHTDPNDSMIDEECLPMFDAIDKDGVKHVLCGEELRTADGQDNPDLVASPLYHVGGKPITDTHPVVVQAFRDMGRL